MGWGGWVGGFPFWDPKVDIGAGGPFCTFVDLKHIVFCISKWDFGEIDFKNDRLKLKINVNPTSWDYSLPF